MSLKTVAPSIICEYLIYIINQQANGNKFRLGEVIKSKRLQIFRLCYRREAEKYQFQTSLAIDVLENPHGGDQTSLCIPHL